MSAVGKGPRGIVAYVVDDYAMDGVRLLVGQRSEDGGSTWRHNGGTSSGYVSPQDAGKGRVDEDPFGVLTTDQAFALHLALAEHFGREAVSDVGFMRDTLKTEQGRVDRLITAVIEHTQ